MNTVATAEDKTFLMHAGGKIEVRSRVGLSTPADLAMAYTPGVALISEAIVADPELAHVLTIKSNTVAIVSDGSAVLGLGNVGPFAAMPVMEGKAMLFKEFGNVNAFPICLATQDPASIIDAVKAISPGFGGICLEDIAAPKCFDIEETLMDELDIPVFHDDQHGTAAVVLAGLVNAARAVGKELSAMRLVVLGAGAAGVACSKAALNAGIGDVVVCDREGAIFAGRAQGMNRAKEWLARHTNIEGVRGSVSDALRGADAFVGVSGPGLVSADDLRAMAGDPIVFALSNPDPEISPDEAAPYARIMATGRSDYPNQINNVLCFPGLFRGLLDSGSRAVTEEMIVAASYAIAGCVSPAELSEGRIIPSVFDRRVSPAVAEAVSIVARQAGFTRPDRESAAMLA